MSTAHACPRRSGGVSQQSIFSSSSASTCRSLSLPDLASPERRSCGLASLPRRDQVRQRPSARRVASLCALRPSPRAAPALSLAAMSAHVNGTGLRPSTLSKRAQARLAAASCLSDAMNRIYACQYTVEDPHGPVSLGASSNSLAFLSRQASPRTPWRIMSWSSCSIRASRWKRLT